MPQPKKKLSATRSGNRRSHLALEATTALACSNCHEPLVAHTVCQACGYYGGKLVMPQKTAPKK